MLMLIVMVEGVDMIFGFYVCICVFDVNGVCNCLGFRKISMVIVCFVFSYGF